MQQDSPLAVVGTGMMGPGIAVTFALVGHPVTLYGRTEASAERGLAHVERILAAFVQEEILSAEEAERARARIGASTNLADAVRGAAVIFESIAEDIPQKRAMFARIEALVPPETIIASNTSGLRISELAAEMRHPERAVTAHFWNPPHLVPLVDVVKGERSSDAAVETVRALLARAGKKPVVVQKDVPGQLGNRLLHAINREALWIIQQGIASAEDVDTAMRFGPGLRFPAYGPVEHSDMVGLDMVLAVQEYVNRDLCAQPRAADLLRDLVARGDLGVKTGRGLFEWTDEQAAAVRERRDRFLLARYKERLADERRARSDAATAATSADGQAAAPTGGQR